MAKRIILAGLLGAAAIYMLYKNIWASLIGSAVFIAYVIWDRKSIKENKNKKLQTRFLDFLMCLEPLLKTSGTFFQAFREAALDYRRFHGKDYISACLDAAVNDFRMNIPTSEALGKMAEKLDFEDARAFADSMTVCETTGGNPVEITGRTTELLVAKIRIVNDINTVLSGKIFECRIITLMPFVLLGLFSLVSDSYLEPLYSSMIGRVIMTVAGALFLLQWLLGKKLVNIEV